MAYMAEAEDGSIVSVKSEDLVMATCYTDAETIAMELMKGKDTFGEAAYEIVKTKITTLLYNKTLSVDQNLVHGLVTYYFEEGEESEVGLYAVSAVIGIEDEKTGKVKFGKVTVHVPAGSPGEAVKHASAYIDNAYMYVSVSIRNVKYDKAQSILVTTLTHQGNVA